MWFVGKDVKWGLVFFQHRKIEEEIKRKEAEIRNQERLALNSDEDSGVSRCRRFMYFSVLCRELVECLSVLCSLTSSTGWPF